MTEVTNLPAVAQTPGDLRDMELAEVRKAGGLRALWEHAKGAFAEGKQIVGGLIDAAEEQFEALAAEVGESTKGFGADKKDFVREGLELILGKARTALIWPLISVVIDAIVAIRNLRKARAAA